MTNNVVGLYRSRRHQMIAGVMGGIAEHYGWNANLLRLIFVIVSISSAAFPGILVYLVLWFVLPKPPLAVEQSHSSSMRTVNRSE